MKYKLILIALLCLLLGHSINSKADTIQLSPKFAFETSTNLGISAVYTSSAIRINGHKWLQIMANADQDSATDGIIIDYSTESNCDTATSPTWISPNTFTYTTANDDGNILALLNQSAYCVRVRYTNGGVAQTSFNLRAVLTTGG